MKPIYSHIFILISCSILLSFRLSNPKCKHNKIPYSTSAYSGFKQPYASFFDSVASNRFEECICGRMPSDFNKLKYDKYTSILIEPVYVNFQNCDGIYAQRVFGRVSPLYKNRKFPHELFVIQGKVFRSINNADSLEIKKIVESKEFSDLYSRGELDTLYNFIKHGRVWTEESILAPYNVKDNGKRIYDAYNEVW